MVLWLAGLACSPESDSQQEPPAPTETDTGAATGCAEGFAVHGTACIPCDKPTGTLHERKLKIDGEQRFYLLHVPEGYTCNTQWPILFDLHGTASYSPEEAYALDGAIATADAEGFILVRPRSRSGGNGYEIYRWDQNAGDPQRNQVFINALAEDLAGRYAIDPERVYVMGFSSGTNQTSVMATDTTSPFKAFGHVGGGAWTVGTQPSVGRFYLHTPFRDYMRTYHHELSQRLDVAGHPREARFERMSFSGHDLYDWAYPELWAFLDRGERPDPGAITAGWERIAGAPSTLLAVTVDNTGTPWFTGAEGEVVALRNDAFVDAPISGVSTLTETALTSICFVGDGRGAVVGNGNVLWTDDDGASWRRLDPLPEPGDPMFGYAHWTGVGCSTDGVMGVGYWSAGILQDADTVLDVPLGSGVRAQATSATQGPTGTWLTTGYYRWLGRSIDGGLTSAPRGWSLPMEWILDAAPVTDSVWVVVGDGGTIVRSTDDGESFTVIEQRAGMDLYSVAFRSDGVGMAVGRSGTARWSVDGGLTWGDVSLGVDVMLSDVAFLPDGTALVAGEGGPYVYTP